MASFRPTEPLLSAPPAQAEEANLQLHVVFTTVAATKQALCAANDLAHDLGARLTLLVAQIVPYPLALDCPPARVGLCDQILSELASQVEVDLTVRVYLCRDRNEAIRGALRPGSIVVIGSRKGWWLGAERILARMLKRDGHNVIVIKANRFHGAETRLAKARTSL